MIGFVKTWPLASAMAALAAVLVAAAAAIGGLL